MDLVWLVQSFRLAVGSSSNIVRWAWPRLALVVLVPRPFAGLSCLAHVMMGCLVSSAAHLASIATPMGA